MPKKLAPTPDEGLKPFDDWHAWFIDSHRQRLRNDGHDATTIEDLMIPILAQADAITAKQREDYLARQMAT